jgi:HlyD family secretion protein
VTYTVIVEAHNPKLLLKPGMTATMNIMVARAENVLAVSNASLRFLPPPEVDAPEPPEGPVVWRLAAKNRLEPVAVSLGVSDGVWTEVKDSSLNEGDKLVVGLTEPAKAPSERRMRGPF